MVAVYVMRPDATVMEWLQLGFGALTCAAAVLRLAWWLQRRPA